MADTLKQIKLLESQDTRVNDDARQALSLQISMGTGIPQLVAYYTEHRSERALDLLVTVKEPYDKTLLDALTEAMKQKRCEATIIMLGQVVQTAPSWMPKIATHPVFRLVLAHVTKAEHDMETIAGLLFLSNLLPHFSPPSEATLRHLFETLLATCEAFLYKWIASEKAGPKQDFDQRVNITHLGFAIREYFHTLYGIYPSNLLAFMKATFGDHARLSKDRKLLMQVVIRPLLNGVRLHPNLILLNRDSELNQERWAQREAHDFLDDCRRVAVGIIPMPATEKIEGSSEQEEEVGPISPQLYASLFPSGASSNSDSSNFGWDDWNGIEGDMMSAMNTPPGSVASTPMQKRSTVDEAHAPMIISSEERARRRSTGHTAESTSRFRLSSLKSVFKKSMEKRVPSSSTIQENAAATTSDQTIEILLAEEEENERREAETVEEGVEAGDENTRPECKTPVGETQVMNVSVDVQDDDGEHSSPDSCAESQSTVKSHRNKDSLTSPTGEGLSIAAAARAARRAIRDRSSTFQYEEPLQTVARSRSTSFLHGAPSTHSEPRDRTNTEETGPLDTSDVAADLSGISISDNMDGRTRFSITSFFKRINRQRFVSECPTLDGGDIEDLQQQHQQKQLAHNARRVFSLERTTSCPNLVAGEKPQAITIPLTTKTTGAIRDSDLFHRASENSTANLLSRFPYLKVVKPYTDAFYAHQEASLEKHHETKRVAYINASKEFHVCLKELGLADRLPGKIYDDMTNFLVGLTIDKQRDVLKNRLQLVNQHLLYERSCRLLHMNRNRRLFGRIKQQKVTESDITDMKKKLHLTSVERSELIKALSSLRQSFNEQTRSFREREMQMNNAIKMLKKEKEDLKSTLDLNELHMSEMRNECRIYKQNIDILKRRADDADAQKIIAERNLLNIERSKATMNSVMAENQNLRDQIASERGRKDSWRGEDKMCSPSGDEKLNLALQAELEKLRQEREQDKASRDEMRRRCLDAEANLKAEVDRCNELKMLLDRSSRLLREQNDAAEQKFLSLQAITMRQEEHTFELYKKLEEYEDCGGIGGNPEMRGTSMAIPRSAIPNEIRSFESSISDAPHSYFIREITALSNDEYYRERDQRSQSSNPADNMDV